MAIVRLPDLNRTITDTDEIRDYLSSLGITYEEWAPAHDVAPDANADDILAAYSAEIERLKAEGGYVAADVINVNPSTPGLEAMLAKFSREHWHDDDEVRFIIHGRGVFHIHPRGGDVAAIEVSPGDLIRVPAGTHHWFDLCAEREIRAIRLFKDPAGWTPNYTETGAETGYQPVCLGPAHIPPQSQTG
ncbi:MAG: cupin domain-containing protein [Blastocatellales bacterium]|nr:cupin domain-containing protein [Blastocatellales bacterium]